MSKSVIRANILNRNTLFGPTVSKIKKRAFTRIKLSPVTALLSVRHNVKQIQSHTYLDITSSKFRAIHYMQCNPIENSAIDTQIITSNSRKTQTFRNLNTNITNHKDHKDKQNS